MLTLPLVGAGVHPAPPVAALQLAFQETTVGLNPTLVFIAAVGVGCDFPGLAPRLDRVFGVVTAGVADAAAFLIRFEVGIDTDRDSDDDSCSTTTPATASPPAAGRQ
jgi:hypothetical protein